MPSFLKVYPIGAQGLDIDSDPISLDDQELTLAQNVMRDPVDNGLRKRPGLTIFNGSFLAGPALGGIGVPVVNLSTSGILQIYLGRGPV